MTLRNDLAQPLLDAPERTFLIDVSTGQETSYAQFARAVASLSGVLRLEGVRPGSRVATLLPNCPEYVVLYFACMNLGATIIPINPVFSQEERAQIIALGEPDVFVHDPALLPDGASPSAVRSVVVAPGQLQAWLREPSDVSHLWRDFNHDALFLIAFSSGTTGQPKGVCHSAGNLLHAAKAFNQHTGARADDRYYHVLSLSYMAGLLNMLLCPYLAGSTIALDDAFTARTAMRFWKAPVRYELDTMWLVPTMLSAILHANRDEDGARYAKRHMRHAFVGTAPLPPSLYDEFRQRYEFELLESYGMTEVLFVSANQPGHNCPGSVGSLLPGVELQVAANASASDQAGDGELLVRAPYSTTGYLGSGPAPQWFPTGDIGCLDPHGHLRITGRKKDLIIRGGINVSPRRVEDRLMEHAGVRAVAVIGVPHRFYGEEVVAVVELHDDFDLAGAQPELEKMAQSLSVPSQPTRYVVRDALPRSSSGKVRKAQLREELSS